MISLQKAKVLKLQMIDVDQRYKNRGTNKRYGTAFSVILLRFCWEEGVKSGRSSRGLGSELKTGKEDCKYVQMTLQLGMCKV